MDDSPSLPPEPLHRDPDHRLGPADGAQPRSDQVTPAGLSRLTAGTTDGSHARRAGTEETSQAV